MGGCKTVSVGVNVSVVVMMMYVHVCDKIKKYAAVSCSKIREGQPAATQKLKSILQSNLQSLRSKKERRASKKKAGGGEAGEFGYFHQNGIVVCCSRNAVDLCV